MASHIVAPSAVAAEIIICARQDAGFVDFFGTAQQLIDEGVVPRDLAWPAGRSALWIKFQGQEFRVRRHRPAGSGMKGWDHDYWCVSSQSDHHEATVRAKRRELARAESYCDPRQIDVRTAFLDKVCRAHKDKRFVAFLDALIDA